MVVKSNLKNVFLTIGLCLGLHAQINSQVELMPSQNPCAVKTHHWTNSVKWSNVINALEIPKMVDYTSVNNDVDSTILVNTLENLEKQGGGVLYFPSGTYYFGYNLPMFNGVIIRGAAPIEKKDADGKMEELLITSFEFPKYIPTGLGKGNPNHKAFKTIFTPQNLKNFGLVNININRGMIDFTGITNHKTIINQNVILCNIRQNNVAFPNPMFPTNFQVSNDRSWQRWVWKFVGNINVNASKNCLIKGCKLNDNVTDTYPQNYYMIDGGMVVDGSKAKFNYTNHLGINVNNSLEMLNESLENEGLNTKTSGKTNIPKCEGLEITDNIIHLTEGNKTVVAWAKKGVISNNQNVLVADENLVKEGNFIMDKKYTLLTDGLVQSEARMYINKSNNDTLPYRLIKPKNYNPQNKYPVVLFFHHRTESGNDNISQLRQFVWQFVANGNQEKYPCFIVAPQKPIIPDSTGEAGWVDERPSLSSWGVPWRLVASIKAINNLKKEFNLDPERVYVVGIGQGGDAVWDLLIRFPAYFAAGVPISSWYEFTEERTSKIIEMPIWMFNGGSVVDSPMDLNSTELPLTRMMQLNIFKETRKVKHTEFSKSGTICWDNIEQMTDFLPWLFDQKKVSPLSLSSK
jgi:predicted peptidase